MTEHIIDIRDNEAKYCRTCGYLEGETKEARLASFCVAEDNDPGFEIFPQE